ncbi:hypothetical protein EG329_013689 [Mollisiaceae sp. DMI_Dod_QoI]|nr:hypothetical protein EG329_013689 [Helotiales sp. DMI_Dod_QoI]
MAKREAKPDKKLSKKSSKKTLGKDDKKMSQKGTKKASEKDAKNVSQKNTKKTSEKEAKQVSQKDSEQLAEVDAKQVAENVSKQVAKKDIKKEDLLRTSSLASLIPSTAKDILKEYLPCGCPDPFASDNAPTKPARSETASLPVLPSEHEQSSQSRLDSMDHHGELQ